MQNLASNQHQPGTSISPHSSVNLKRPLVQISVAMAVLDCTEDQVLQKIERGDLPFAFDISCGVKHSCIRILSRSISELQARGPELKRSLADCKRQSKEELGDIINSLLPQSRVAFRSGEIARLLNCNLNHLTHLAQAGHLLRRPIHRNHEISRATMVNFLQKRRVL